MISFLITMSGVAGAFGVFDRIIPEKQKNEISNYIFGFHNLTFSEFENKIIRALLTPFIKDNRLRKRRVLVYSIAVSIIYTALAFIILNLFSELDGNVVQNSYLVEAILFGLVLGLVSGPFSFPFDFWSLSVTKFLFYDRFPKAWLRPVFFVIDVFLSLLPLVVVFYIAGQITQANQYTVFEANQETLKTSGLGMFSAIIGIGTMVSIVSVLFLSVIQIISILLGGFIRLIIKITHLNAHIAMKTDAPKNPMTFIGIIVGVMVATYTHVIIYQITAL